MSSMEELLGGNRFLAEIARFGTVAAEMHERGIVDDDMRADNLGVDDSGRILPFDASGLRKVEYPGEPDVYATSLCSFIGTCPAEAVAPFRLGYLHHGGPVARQVCRRLRSHYGISAFQDRKDVGYQVIEGPSTTPRLATLGNESKVWMAKRRQFPSASLLDRYWGSEGTELLPVLDREGARLRRVDAELSEYVYTSRLVGSVYAGDMPAAALTLVNLSTLRWDQGFYVQALGYVHVAMAVVALSGRTDEASQRVGQISFVHYERYKKEAGGDQSQLLDSIPIHQNVFVALWGLEDLMQGAMLQVEEG